MLAAAARLIAPAAAQDLDGRVTVVEELIARPTVAGPAWWKVGDEDSAIYVLVDLAWVPKDIAFDMRALERRLAGAKLLILPADASYDPFTIARVLLNRGSMKDGGTVEGRLSPEARRIFRRVIARSGRSATYYDGLSPSPAADMIEFDYFTSQGFGMFGLREVVQRAARPHRIRTQKAAIVPIERFRMDQGREPGVECLEARVRNLDLLVRAQREAAAAWAEGDVRPILFPKGTAAVPERCGEEHYTNAAGLAQEMIGKEVTLFEQTLRTPGHSVALIKGEELLAKGGVLDQLRAKGYRVTTPDLIQD
jgi:uncharacterized protein YbaP (TraB family)